MDSDISSVILIDSDNDGGSVGICIQDSPLAKSEAVAAAAEDTKDNSIVVAEDCINLDDSDDHNGDAKSSSSSSSSSGIPSPLFKQSLAKTAATLDRPPSIIHTANNNNNNDTPIRGNNSSKVKKGLTNSKQTVYRKEENSTEDDMSCFTDMSTTSTLSKRGSSKADENDNAETAVAKKQPANKQQRKKRQWGYKNRKRNTTSATAKKSSNDDITTSTTSSIPSTAKAKKSTEEATNKHFHCYLLRSLDPSHPLKTYIGFTTHPQRRIRQHNGILKNGGARRTKRSGRPWTFVCVIHGFQDKITALQFEWAWQNVDKSKAFREAVGDDTLARKMKRRYSPKARLEELRILLKECLPFCLYSLTVYFPEREYHDIFSGILKRGKNGNPYIKDADESESAYEPLMNIEVCALENMPMAKEVAELKAKKIAKKEAAKALKQSQQKKKVPNYNKSDRLENVKALTREDDSCWSDFLESSDDENDANNEGSKCSKGNLKTIKEKNDSSSIDLCDISSSSSMDDDEKSRDTMSTSNKYEKNDDAVDDISKDLFSMSMGAPKKKRADSDECDFSTISSANDSHCSVDNDVVESYYVIGKSSSIKFSKKGIEKENHRPLPSANDSFNKKSAKATGSMSDDVVDLCDSD